MEKAESAAEQLHVCTETTAESCTKLFSIRQYVYLSRQKNIFQNWPFPEKYLKSCLEYGVTNVLPPLEARVVLERKSISCDKGNVANVGNDHDTLVEATISMKSEQFQLVTLSCNDQKQEEENPSDVLSPGYRYMNEVTPISPSVVSAREGNKTRKWRRKMKTMAEIFATAKHCTLEEVDEMNDLSCTSVTALDIEGEHRRKNQVDFEYFDSKSELTDDGADCNNRLSKRLGRAFFENLGYVVDGVVVVVALVLELALARVGGGLLVVVSLWRVVRAVESVFELSDDAIQAKVE
uniref:Uncharacterized protein n=1 Tax=Chenopodium quinoa TaxID=63459 RepID=A0A803LTE7_CHEQI